MKLTLCHPDNLKHEEIPSIGLHLARCVGLWDIGTQNSSFANGHTDDRRVILAFEVVDQLHPIRGTPFFVWWRYSASLQHKSRLRRHIEGWLDCSLDELRSGSFELATLLGRPCQLLIGRSTNTINPRATLEQIFPPPANANLPDVTSGLSYFSFDNPSMDAFEKLPKAVQRAIVTSLEWKMFMEHRSKDASATHKSAA